MHLSKNLFEDPKCAQIVFSRNGKVLLVHRQFFNLGGILLGNTVIFLKMKIIKAIHFLFKMKFNTSENISF